jgi:hypothetical protein
MLISAPFLKSGTTEDNTDSIQLAFTGQYPVTSHLEWHNGQHLVAPQENGSHVDVRAIADGKVIYTQDADKEPSHDKSHAQNYAAFGAGPEWTDKGMVIIEHTTEIGADGATSTKLTFYSVYAHMKELATGIAKDKKVYRKDILGKPGQIYGQPGHIHFEICLDDTNIQLLLGQDPKDRPAADTAPTKDGRIDAVFGSTYIYLPASTPVQTAVPTSHMRGTTAQTLNTPQWVQITYTGKATTTSYKMDGSTIGAEARTDADAEYDLYKEATKRHDSLGGAEKAASSPSGWYELLRFGRNLGRGPTDTDKDPLPKHAAHWRKINTPTGEQWADLRAEGTFKFSDADFPAFLGWNCFGDDEKVADQRCDSRKLKALLSSEIIDAQDKARALKEPLYLFAQTRQKGIAAKLRKAICKFPTEFDQGDFEARYGHIKEEEYFKSDTTGKNWKLLSEHIRALTCKDLPDVYKSAQWHLHPMAFIEVMRMCGWLSKEEFIQLLPSHALRTGKWRDAQHQIHDGVFWEQVTNRLDNERSIAAINRIPLNKTLRKYGMTTPMRQASFFGNAVQETGWLSGFSEGNGNGAWYAPWFGRGFLQLTGPSNYAAYWRWRGRPFSTTLEASLTAAYNDMYGHSARRSQRLLADAHFGGVTKAIQDWRDQVHGEEKISQDEGRSAPCDSAGFYSVLNNLPKHADETHILERHVVATVNAAGGSTGEHVYYRSQAFWKVSASVNLPGAVNHINYLGINGFDARCSAYGVALAVLTETRFPNAQGQEVLEYPEGYKPRRS